MSPTEFVGRHRVSTDPEHLALLVELAKTSGQIASLMRRKEQLVEQCIEAGHSERAIGQAAGVSGPAINQRKKRRANA